MRELKRGWVGRAAGLALGLVLAASLTGCGGKTTISAVPTDEIVAAQIINLENPDHTVRRGAARALGRNGPQAAKAVPSLLRATEDVHPTVRVAAREALIRIQATTSDGVLARADGKARP